MTELFNIEESLSPYQEWENRHCISAIQSKDSGHYMAVQNCGAYNTHAKGSRYRRPVEDKRPTTKQKMEFQELYKDTFLRINEKEADLHG